MWWANLLHIYQPPTQTEAIVRKVAGESYRTLVRVLRAYPRARITLNINAVLTEQLHRYGLADVIIGFRELAERGQVEFTASAMFHPILPLIPETEMARQIELNTAVNQRYFGDVYVPRGFFPPEMCYSPAVGRMVAEMGFGWIILDEITFNGKLGRPHREVIGQMDGSPGLSVFFRDRRFSNGISFGDFPSAPPFLQALGRELPAHDYIVTATDGEVYGHHRPGQEHLLEQVWEQGEPATVTLSQLLELFPQRQAVSPLSASWSAWEDELAQGIPYPQWRSPSNQLHQLQWELVTETLAALREAPADAPGYEQARRLADEGLHSCQFWWASGRPHWDTGMIERGAQRLRDAALALGDALWPHRRRAIEALYECILSTAREWQESGKAAKCREQYFQEHPRVTTELTFGPGPRP